MKKRNYNIKEYKRLSLLFAFLMLFGVGNLWADGSKDLYPQGREGLRARLYTGPATSPTSRPAYPFPNNGIHYVYAKPGETITLASSAQQNNTARIRLYNPSGTAVISGNQSNGIIANRTQELAGPRLPGQGPGGNRYLPIYYEVPQNGEGVYRIEFIGRSTTGDPAGTSLVADGNWTQSNNAEIMAWDISVVNTDKDDFIPGRVYANVLNLTNGYQITNANGFYGLIYALTKDGYTYRVNNNGNNGLFFTFFVNNNGFVDRNTQLPSYKSINSTAQSELTGRVHNPNNADVGTHITHKMFYTQPSDDLPETANIAVTNNSGTSWAQSTTWLKIEPVQPEVTQPELVGADGSTGQVSNKGGYVEFDADVQGNYEIEIMSNVTPAQFPTRVLTGQASAGSNRVLWDGKDGSGNSLPVGNVPVKVTVQLQGAEVHFPFFDMEYNQKGIIIELTNGPEGPTDPDRYKVYWNDSDIPNATGNWSGNNSPGGRYSDPKNNSHLPVESGGVNSQGIDSDENGHIWGIGASGIGGQFGDEKSIDTWTFITGEKKDSESSVNVKIADLQITSIETDKDNVDTGDDLAYTVKVKNNGPSEVESAPFTFKLPPGFEPMGNPVFEGDGCGSQDGLGIEYDAATRTYHSKLDLPNGCEITYEFPVKVTNEADPNNTEALAGILRPNDVADPNATNKSEASKPTFPLPSGRAWDDLWKYPADWPDAADVDNYYIPPFSAEFECMYRPADVTEDCNNTALHTVNVTLCEEVIFFEDFGTSDLNDGNFGRMHSPYMPTNSFAFGTPYPTSTNYDEYMIDNNHYGVVAPGYIKAGTEPYQYYFWTPAYNEPNTVTDRSGTEEGAVMVINAGETLLPFYQREHTVESETTYRASFWLYLVNGPSQVAIDIINKTTGEVLGTVESEMMEDWDTTYKGQWTQHTLHFTTPDITPNCNLNDVILSIRNTHAATQGNDYFIDDIKFSKLVCDIPTEGVVEIKCPEFECPAGTDQVELSKNALSNSELPQVGESLFFDDFGASDLNNGNKGRVESPFMPDNGFDFGDSYLNLPTPTGNLWDDNPVRNAARINDGFYAVVAPGYINEGWFDDDGWDSWWTPSYNESNPIYDYSGTETGAALVVNAGENLTAFYERTGLIQAGAKYKASFKLFVVKAPAQVGIDIIDPVTLDTLYTMQTAEYQTDYNNNNYGSWRDIEIDFVMPGSSCNGKEVIVSFRNHFDETDGNDWYVDDIRLEKIEDAPTCPPVEDCVDHGIDFVNLNDAFTGTVPANSELVWYTTSDRQSGTKVDDPTHVKESGDYYAFFYSDEYECYNTDYSTAVVEVIILQPCVTVIATPDINQTPENTPVDGNVLTNDSGDDIKVTEITVYDASGNPQNVSVPTTGTVTEDVYAEDPNSPGNYIKTGTIKIDSEGHYTFTPEEGFTGNVPIEYTIEDEKGNTDNTTLTIEVIPTYNQSENSKPIAQDDAYTTIEGEIVISNVLSNDSDPDGDTLSVTEITQGSNPIPVGTPTTVSGIDLQGNPVSDAGTVTIDTDGKITFVPNSGFIGKIDPINYVAEGGKGGSDDANVYINVLPNDGANTTFAYDDANVAPKGVTMTGNVLDNDFDPEGDDQTLTSITIEGTQTLITTSGTEVQIPGKGTLTISPDGSYTFVPEPGFVGTVVVEQIVCDDGSPQACDSATLYLTTLDNKSTRLITNPMIRQKTK